MRYFLLSMPNATELLLIIGAILLLFGGKKIPELMRGLGRGIREFNDAKDGARQELQNVANAPAKDSQSEIGADLAAERKLQDSVPRKS